jgi:cell division protein ZapA
MTTSPRGGRSARTEALTVTVRIMGNEYAVVCPEEEHEALVASAEFLNQRMMAIRRRGKALGAERIAVMAALNMARELLALKGEPAVAAVDPESLQRLQQLCADIDSALADADLPPPAPDEAPDLPS